MMPHPERGPDDELGNTDGRLIFESILAFIRKQKKYIYNIKQPES